MNSPHSIKKGILPLLVKGNQLYFTKFNNKIYKASLPRLINEVQIMVFPMSFKNKFLGKNSFLNKVFRIGPHAFIEDNGMSVVSLKNIIFSKTNNASQSFNNFKGTRPLNIESANGTFFFGEYFSNPSRDRVNIFAYNTLANKWETKYTFHENSIRHIHSIKYDQYRNGYWILSGDENSESALWFTSDFKKLKAFGDWSQNSRAVKIIPTKEFLIVPMDTPYQKNYINYFYPEKNNFKQVIELPGSAFHAEEIGNYYIVSTVVEPSKVNLTNSAEIYICKKDSQNWEMLFSGKRSNLPIKYSHYYRYPELVVIPTNDNSPFLVTYGRSLKKYEAKTLIWDTSLLK